jgi:hypothetical protein
MESWVSMRSTLKAILIFNFLLLHTLTFAEDQTYYVTQNGKGSKDGKSLKNAWSLLDFKSSKNWSTAENHEKIDPGDTVFFSGMFSSQIDLPKGAGGADGKYVTLDGWEGGTCNPVENHDPICDPKISGQGCDDGVDLNACPTAAIVDLGSTELRGINFQTNNYIIVQDFQIRDVKIGIIIDGLYEGCDHIIIRRNYIHDVYAETIHAYSGDNTYITIGGADGDGNFLYNASEQNRPPSTGSSKQLNIGGNDIIFSYNEIGCDWRHTHADGNVIEVHNGDRFLFEYNTIFRDHGGCGISIKENGASPVNSDGIVRFNKFFDVGYMVSVSSSADHNEDIFVYGNFGYDIGGFSSGLGQGLRALKFYTEIHFWSNIISLSDSIGLGAMGWTGEARHQGPIYFYNNTVYKCGQKGDSSPKNRVGFYANCTLDCENQGLDLNVVNNIFANCDSTNYYAMANGAGSSYTVPDSRISAWGDNIWYYDGQTPKIYWKGTAKTLSQFQNDTPWGGGTVIDNPGFTDADGKDNKDGTSDDNFTLTSDSPAVSSGTDLSSCFNITIQGIQYNICYDDGLDPTNTNWSTTPPKVAILKRDIYGWSKGAYVYTGGAERRSHKSLSPPISLRISN